MNTNANKTIHFLYLGAVVMHYFINRLTKYVYTTMYLYFTITEEVDRSKYR